MEPKLSTIVKIVAQAGITGIAAMALWLLYTISSNHIDHNTAAFVSIREAMVQLSEVVAANTKQNERVENALINLKR